MKHILTFVLLVFFSQAFGLEIKPYPQAKITPEQWQKYYAEVKTSIGTTEKRAEDQGLVTYNDSAQHVHYAFTLENHPAHPAWIARIVLEKNGELFVQQIGYFAGDEQPFAKLFAQYQSLNKEMQKWLNEERNKKR